jgi:hypothetical protein
VGLFERRFANSRIGPGSRTLDDRGFVNLGHGTKAVPWLPLSFAGFGDGGLGIPGEGSTLSKGEVTDRFGDGGEGQRNSDRWSDVDEGKDGY